MIRIAFSTILLITSGWLLGETHARAGGPENAVIVVNGESPSSKLIANHYIFLRKIPSSNVIYLNNIPQGEFVSLKDAREKILIPVFTAIERRGLANHIDYVIYSSGFPTSIRAYEIRDEWKTSGDPNQQRVANDKSLAPELSLTSATFYYQSVIAEDHAFYLSLNSNLYMRKGTRHVLTKPFVDTDQVQFNRAIKFSRDNDYERAAKIFTALAKKHPNQMSVLYWLARVFAKNGDQANAIKWLKRAIAAGWNFREYTMSDPAFVDLVDTQEFRSVSEFIPNLPFRHLATQSFKNTYFWAPNGSVNSTPDQGARYMLSVMLGVNRNQGNTEKETLSYLRRSVMADGTNPQGTFYFTDTDKIQTRPRKPGFADAIAELALFGFEAEIIKTKLPMRRDDVAGLMMGSGRFKWSSSGSKILPGAICEDLTSYAGRLAPETKQTKLSEFLRYGAAGSSGTVREPFAIQAKFPQPRIHVHYARGCTLAEAFYQSVSGPFQLLIVGDALCKPWAQIPEIEVTGDLSGDAKLTGKIDIKFNATGTSVPIQETDLYLNGRLFRRLNRTGKQPISIDSTKLPDGYHEFRIVPIAAGTIATHGLHVFPLEIDNGGHSVKLECNSESIKVDDVISFSASAPKAKEIRLLHNGRIVGHKMGESSKFKIPAKSFGRGPVSIVALATIEGKPIRSWPVQINIGGRIASTLPIEESPFTKQRKKRAQAKKRNSRTK